MPGSTPSRATEKTVRAVRPARPQPQARNAASTTAANGFADQEPNEQTTAVETGSRSRAGDDVCRVRVRERRRDGVEHDRRAATLSNAIQIARGTCRAASPRLLGRPDTERRTR